MPEYWEHEREDRVYEIYKKSHDLIGRYQIRINGSYLNIATTLWGARRIVRQHQNRNDKVLVERITG
jgi:hypothetical protein